MSDYKSSWVQPSSTVLLLDGIYKLLYLAQQADDAFFRENAGAALQSFDILENDISVFSHWTTLDQNPLTCYSHNTRGRLISLESAIDSGCLSIEMTLFPTGNELLIGPNPNMLSRAINLRGLYIDPLLKIIREHNAEVEYPRLAANENEDELVGVFENDPTQSLVLLMNFDADPDRAWSLLLPHLEPLREVGLLTYFNGSAVVQGPLTIVASGKVPFPRILERSTLRDVFYDAPLLELSSFSAQSPPQNSDYSDQNSYYASASFHTAIGHIDHNGISKDQLSNLRQQVKTTHALGLKIRYSITPNWPRELRDYVWRILFREGVDTITYY
ncbi:cellobiose dehydrogenase [Penicillium atrosanguineum]|uniref:cellobiose dehydrogenase n=1 Tax=Penicillium atrosanguineum TaxID=1132637 RepID=UPI00238C49FC|nr:cellobiose dehydrogenase [Penicillium atrosanguineum]KAJ5293039.1 cellobiose dehydrogenase [Penicillium atrosanguineum]